MTHNVSIINHLLVTCLALGLSGGQGRQEGEHVLPELGGEAEVDIVVCPPGPGQHQHIVGGEVSHYVELGTRNITVLGSKIFSHSNELCI